MSADAAKARRKVIKTSLTRFKKHVDAFNAETDIAPFKARLEKFEPVYDAYNQVQSEIEALIADDDAQEVIQNQDRDQFETSYFEVISKAKDIIARAEPQPNIRSTQTTRDRGESASLAGINLPKITLPTFDGAYGSWLKFRDTFKSLIHDHHSLSNIQKFHYLNSALVGDAARVIQSLGISDANYTLAWESLNSRYEDSKSLIHHHIRSIFELPVIAKDSFSALRQLIDDANNHLLALKTLGEKTDSWDTMVIYLLTTKLDIHTKREWEKALLTLKDKPKLLDLTGFLENHCKYLHKLSIDKGTSTATKTDNKSNNSKGTNNVKSHTATKKSCPVCKETHPLYACEEFKKLSAPERVQKVRELKVCYNCFSSGHRNKDCKLGGCRKCSRKHNTLIHLDGNGSRDQDQAQVDDPSIPPVIEQSSGSRQATLTAQASSSSGTHVLLATATVYLYDQWGSRLECRALLDSGSQPHFITQQLSQRLGLKKTKSGINVSGIEQGNHTVAHQMTVKLQSRINEFKSTITCLVIDKITDDMPNIPKQLLNFEIPKGIELADPSFDRARPIDLLIGAGLFYDLVCVGQIRLGKHQPLLHKTQLGWIISGPISLSTSQKPKVVCNLATSDQLSNQLAKFWEIENCFSELNHYDEKDYCEQHFKNTTKRDTNGRFVVSIPFKDDFEELGQSYEIAYKRFLSIERKLGRQPELKEQYGQFMAEYETLGHMTELSEQELKQDTANYYLPHHAVTKTESTTTKLRVVFDGSAKTTSGKSLNDVQFVGPTVQDDLFSIILRFRQHRYVLSADITKMYRQINVQRDHQEFQRILWRTDNQLPVKHFRLNTVTYGTASGPFLATRCLRQLSEECKEQHSFASNVIKKDFYVDDLLTGTESLEAAKNLKNDLNHILEPAGFELRKWASNEPCVFLQTDNTCSQPTTIQNDKDPKTLGLLWDPDTDTLKYRVLTNEHRKTTKRTILSDTAQIFDPLGLAGPATIKAKIILQRLWQLQLDWDESLPQDLHTQWQQFYQQLVEIHSLSIQRHVVCKNPIEVEFHGFCDASESAYGACIYSRSTNGNGEYTVRLVCAKSRVAPLKAMSLPRLELSGALLLAQLAHKVTTACNISINQWTFWTDSTITLAWIKAPSNRWKTFVANRTSEIQELTNENWNHVESAMNPADLISRGIDATELLNAQLWWNGPSWLAQDTATWPRFQETNVEEIPEQKKGVLSLLSQQVKTLDIFGKFSSFTRLVRTTAYCLRFIANCKGGTLEKKRSSLDPGEIQHATTCLLKRAQIETLPLEISDLQKNRQVSTKSKLKQLNPFLDKAGLLRVGGRLSNAPIPYNQRHPIILDPKHKLTHLIIKNEHLRLMHAGCQSVVASLRTRYWPLSAKNSVKKILRQCLTCFRVRPIESSHIMGNLPASRVTPRRPFHHCGVDYAGPFLLKEKTRSRVATKAYICIFVCFSTKAVHIELAHDLSTAAFLNCFKRFISRRGRCAEIYSDNGTNFVGAKNELNELQQLLSNEEVQSETSNFLTTQHIKWHLIPPHAPHFGGLWESSVKSTKYHLKRVIGETRLTYEELYTVLTQVEACLNSRPLSPLSTDPSDLTPLTPGHFLIGDSLMAPPQADLRTINTNRLDRYQHLQQMLQHFWQRWQCEYLHQLQQRHKWAQSSPERLKPGTMVIVRDDNAPPMRWPLGRVIQVHPGKDGVTRVVSVQLTRGIVKRPVSKICILPFNREEGDDGHLNNSSNL